MIRHIIRLPWQCGYQPACNKQFKMEEIFEELSVLDRILRQDLSGVYSLMDFPSRDYYRHMIERLAQNMIRMSLMLQ